VKRLISVPILAICSLAVAIDKQEFTLSTHRFPGVTQAAMFPGLIAKPNNRRLRTITALSLSFRHFSDNPDRVLMIVNCDVDDGRFFRDANVHLFTEGNATDLGHLEKRGVLAKRFEIEVGTFEGGPNEKGLAMMRAFVPCEPLKNLRRPTPEHLSGRRRAANHRR
jgi:hypothetical protein